MLENKLAEYLAIVGRGILLSLIGLFMIGIGTMIPMSLKWFLQ